MTVPRMTGHHHFMQFSYCMDLLYYMEFFSSLEFHSFADVWCIIRLASWQQWNGIVARIQFGDITFTEVDRLREIFADNYAAMLAEFELMCGPEMKKIALERIDQVKKYQELERYRQGATLMLTLKKKFALTGDFKIVETLLNLVSFAAYRMSLLCIVSFVSIA